MQIIVVNLLFLKHLCVSPRDKSAAVCPVIPRIPVPRPHGPPGLWVPRGPGTKPGMPRRSPPDDLSSEASSEGRRRDHKPSGFMLATGRKPVEKRANSQQSPRRGRFMAVILYFKA